MRTMERSDYWMESHRFDKRALPLADRHYSRQRPGSPQVVPPGSCVVLVGRDLRALWVTSWPQAEFTKHRWAGAWVNSLFRNEGERLSSELIQEAVAITRGFYPIVPELGIVTFINPDATQKRRSRKAMPGACYRHAGWTDVGCTEGGLPALQLLPESMPAPLLPWSPQEILAL